MPRGKKYSSEDLDGVDGTGITILKSKKDRFIIGAKLKRMKIFYDGTKCEKETIYKVGTPLSEMSEDHRKKVTDEDLE